MQRTFQIDLNITNNKRYTCNNYPQMSHENKYRKNYIEILPNSRIFFKWIHTKPCSNTLMRCQRNHLNAEKLKRIVQSKLLKCYVKYILKMTKKLSDSFFVESCNQNFFLITIIFWILKRKKRFKSCTDFTKNYDFKENNWIVFDFDKWNRAMLQWTEKVKWNFQWFVSCIYTDFYVDETTSTKFQ